ncbi:MAG: GAF domain-containing protein [Deltaproteobacteria bacterium]|nr:GAF domain-containing protein [Deltaproteobacteria bacterium]
MPGKPTYEELEKRVGDLEQQVAGLMRLEKAPHNQLKKFQVLYDLATAMTTERSLDDNLQLVVDRSRELLDADTSYIALRDESRDDVFMHSFSGIRTEKFKKVRIPFGEGLGGLVAKTMKGYIIEDYLTSKDLTRPLHKIVADEGLVSGMAAPIQMEKKNLGVLYLFNRKETFFSQSDLDTLFLIANIAAIEIARNQVQEALRNAHHGLEKRVAERTAALSESNALLKQEIAERKRTMEALLESESRLRTLLDFAPYPIVVFTMKGLVDYLNPAFTEVFGWSLAELEGKRIPYVPRGLEEETSKSIKKLLEEKTLLRHETRRLTKDGRILNVVMRGAMFVDSKNELAGELVIVRDITREKRIEQNNEAMLRISMALPEYPDLEMLLDYITYEMKRLLDTEGGIVTLLDEEKQEIFFLSASYDDKATQKRVKGMRFSVDLMDQFVVSKVIRTGEPVIVNDTSNIPKSYPVRDKVLGYQTRNFLQVPLKSSDRIIGVLTAINKKEGAFDDTDIEMLNMVAGTVALSIENAQFSDELKTAYKEVSSLNRAKDKVIHHLSHELKTPTAVLSGSLKNLTKKLTNLPEGTWKAPMERIKRNLDRIMGIQLETEDIIKERQYKTRDLLLLMLDECTDELETLIAEEVGEGPLVERIRRRIEDIFGAREMVPEKIALEAFVHERLEDLKPLFSHRQVEIISAAAPTPPICVPKDPLQKIIDGLVKNAIENTPDEGKIEVDVQKKANDTELVVRDFGVGVTEENQRRIFEGFFATQETIDYSSKRPFDFNAGGKGADLLRMKIFSERYHFTIDMTSSRCQYIPEEGDVCPGRISECPFCVKKEDCHLSGGTVFRLQFPGVSKDSSG